MDHHITLLMQALAAIYDVAHVVVDDPDAHDAALAARSALLASAARAGIAAPGVGDAAAHAAEARELLARAARPAPRRRRGWR